MLLRRYLLIAMADVPKQDPSKQHFLQFNSTLEIGRKKKKNLPVLMPYLLHNSRYYFWLNVVLDENILMYLHNQCDMALPSSTIMAYFLPQADLRNRYYLQYKFMRFIFNKTEFISLESIWLFPSWYSLGSVLPMHMNCSIDFRVSWQHMIKSLSFKFRHSFKSHNNRKIC